MRTPVAALVLAALALTLPAPAHAFDVEQWSTLPGANDDDSPDGFPELMAPTGFHDSAREVMAAIKRYIVDRDPYQVSTGSANAYALSATQSITAYATGQTFSFIPNFTNTGTATLNVDSVGAKEILRPDGSGLTSGDIKNGQMVVVAYSGVDDAFKMLSPVHRAGAGLLRQLVTVSTSGHGAASKTVTSTSAVPALTSMAQILSTSITPADADNKIVIEAVINVSSDDAVTAALFKDSSTNAVYVGRDEGPDALGTETQFPMVLRYVTDAGGTSSQTWIVGVAGSSGSISWNGNASVQYFDGAMESNLSLTEIAP